MSPELREPPRPAPAPGRFGSGAVVGLLAANLVLAAAVGGLVLWRTSAGGGGGDNVKATRQVAAKLQTAGALDEAAALYESVLARSSDTAAAGEPAEARAKIAYSLGSNYLDAGRYEKALRWFYEAETLGPGPLTDDVNRKIVTTLDRLGRPRAAQAALASRVQLGGEASGGEIGGGDVQRAGDDPVVAKIGEREIHRSAIDRALDDLPPEMARALAGASPADLVRRYVADELMWGKAVKLGYDRDPEVLRQQETLAKQLAVARFLDREVVGKIAVDDVDLQSWFAANKERYRRAAQGQGGKDATQEVTLDQVRPAVEREVRLAKAQETYQKMIDAELTAGDVELFPERMGGAGRGAPPPAPSAVAPSAPTPGAAPTGNPVPGAGSGGGSR